MDLSPLKLLDCAPVKDCDCALCNNLRAKQVTDRLDNAVPKHYWKLDPYWHEKQKSKQKGGEKP